MLFRSKGSGGPCCHSGLSLQGRKAAAEECPEPAGAGLAPAARAKQLGGLPGLGACASCSPRWQCCAWPRPLRRPACKQEAKERGGQPGSQRQELARGLLGGKEGVELRAAALSRARSGSAACEGGSGPTKPAGAAGALGGPMPPASALSGRACLHQEHQKEGAGKQRGLTQK